MAKAKGSKARGGANVPQKHLHSRLSFLHQAATHLAQADTRQSSEKFDENAVSSDPRRTGTSSSNSIEAARLLTHLRGVSRKSQIRLAPRMKHSICKRCDGPLIPGSTSSGLVVNPSKNGRKPWADVFEVRCNKCGTIKRFPVGRGKGTERESRDRSGPESGSEAKLSHTPGANPTD